MLSLEQCRQLDPDLAKLSDKELQEVRDGIYTLADIALECWVEQNKTTDKYIAPGATKSNINLH